MDSCQTGCLHLPGAGVSQKKVYSSVWIQRCEFSFEILILPKNGRLCLRLCQDVFMVDSACSVFTGCSTKNFTNLVGSSDVNLALIDGEVLSKCSLIDKLNMITLFVGFLSIKGRNINLDCSNMRPSRTLSFGVFAQENCEAH